ncbi:minor capsid protein [Micromonospora andamanensis]|uniref:DUF3168 domain-containing protein n=1 Tax=Micromonospora andamanensis TaxID=1287068 RepID=A0ABQ4HYY7_9ACTN|nr:minor capsid protein [Micromonospora andamanensis]GIJ10731.1 hypothetical protein Van01_39450 [Micromonospora andamanensis]
MATGDGWTSRLITGLAELLDAADVGTWRPTGGYTAEEIAIVVRGIPQQPDRLITLAPYRVPSPIGIADFVQGVQLRTRGTTDPRVAEDIADACLDLLDSASNLTVGGIAVVQISHRSYTSMGQDNNGRWETSSNYYVEAMRPTIHRHD